MCFTFDPTEAMNVGTGFSKQWITLEKSFNFAWSFNNTFYLPKKQQNTYSQDILSLNTATLSPRNIFNKSLYDKKTGMFLSAISRNNYNHLMSKI